MNGNIYFDEFISIKRIKDDIAQERRFENKRNMREFIKKKCKKKGANYGRYKERNC
jgi:hypothetical protein